MNDDCAPPLPLGIPAPRPPPPPTLSLSPASARRSPTCLAWNFDATAPAPTPCQLLPAVAPNQHHNTTASGVRGAWAMPSPATLTLDRGDRADDPWSGGFSLTGAAEGLVGATTRACARDSFRELWGEFAGGTGCAGVAGTAAVERDALWGAYVVRGTLKAGRTGTLSVVLGWWLPHRHFAGQRVGNFYQVWGGVLRRWG